MIKKIKKGFTLVELLVVIAILAILTTVSVVAYTQFTDKAKESNDVSLTEQLNTLLKADETSNGKPKTMSDVVEFLSDEGYNLEKLSLSSKGYSYVWDSINNRLLLLNSDKEVVFPENVKSNVSNTETESKEEYLSNKEVKVADTYNPATTFALVSNNSEISDTWAGYSVYLKSDFTGSAVSVNYGIDTGKNDGIAVTVTVTSNTTSTIIVNVTGGSVEVKSEENATVTPTVTVYGETNKVTVNTSATVAVAAKVEGTVEVQKGSVEVASTATVAALVVTATAGVSVTASSGATIKSVATTVDNASSVINIPTTVIDTTTIEKVDTDAIGKYSGGLGTEASPYIIGDIAQWVEFANSEDTASCKYWKVTTDLDFSTYTVTNNKYCNVNTFTGSIDFDNHTVTGLTLEKTGNNYSQSYGGLFANVVPSADFETKISNLTYDCLNLGNDKSVRLTLYVGNIKGEKNKGKVILENINTTGDVLYSDNNCSTFVYHLGSYVDLELTNCNNYTNITNSYGFTGVFVGRSYYAIDDFKTSSIVFNNCHNYGTVRNTNGQSSMFISNPFALTEDSFNNITIINCSNKGIIMGTTESTIITGINNTTKGVDWESRYKSNISIGTFIVAKAEEISIVDGEYVLSKTSGASSYTLVISGFGKGYKTEKHGTYSKSFNFDSNSLKNIKAYEFVSKYDTTKTTTIGNGNIDVVTIDKTDYYVMNITDHSDYIKFNKVTLTLYAYDANGNILSISNVPVAVNNSLED